MWLSESWRSFLHSSSVCSCYLLISSASVRSIPFLSFIEPIFAWNVPLVISNFLEEIFRLSHSIVFLYFFALIIEEGFLISPCYSLELCIQMGFLFLLRLWLLFFSQLFVRSPQATVLPFYLSFSWGRFWSLPTVQCQEPLSIVFQALCLSDLMLWIYLSLPLYNNKEFGLGLTWMICWFSLLSSISIWVLQ